MKRVIIVAALVLTGVVALAQNLQLHYDFRRSSGENAVPAGVFTSTVEMFKPDKYGSTFFFIDMNYGEADVKGVSLSYWEISRSLKFWKAPIAIHAEYNGGNGIFKAGNGYGGFPINDAWLFGADYIWNNEGFTRGFTLSAMYKYIQGFGEPSFQLTGVWYMHLFSGKLTFSGFVDFWKQTGYFNGVQRKFVFLTEPQIWYNFNKHFAVGSEIEMSRGFVSAGFSAYPTAAIKYSF